MMRPHDVTRRVDKIRAMKDDDKSAHSEEDKLYQEVLYEIALGSKYARYLAREALKTKDIKFSRWRA